MKPVIPAAGTVTGILLREMKQEGLETHPVPDLLEAALEVGLLRLMPPIISRTCMPKTWRRSWLV